MNKIADNIFTAADDKKIADLMAIDMLSAFDCLVHKILDEKLRLYNFSEKTRKWFTSYLNYRSYYVNVGTKNSEIKTTTDGVPQGSVLGPLIYIIYMNELPEAVKNNEECEDEVHVKEDDDLFGDDCTKCGKVTCYADDCTYVTMARTREENQRNLTRSMEKVADFLISNGMTINPSKTTISEHMVKQKTTRTPGDPPTLLTTLPNGEDKTIIASRFNRLLGGNFQDNLLWRGQLELGKKALLPILRTKIGALKLIARNIPQRGLLYLANGLIISRLVYLLPSMGGGGTCKQFEQSTENNELGSKNSIKQGKEDKGKGLDVRM